MPVILDAGCKAGGASMGYHRAGFTVVGCDIERQPHYPFRFILGDALVVIREMGHQFDAYHGSPPCHDHTPLRARSGLDGTGYLLAEFRAAFKASGKPWVLENVPGSPMRADLRLCGSMFGLEADGFILRRHRLFESSVDLADMSLVDSCLGRPAGGVHGGGGYRRIDRPGIKFNASQSREAMGISWMTRDELAQAIPPAYTEYVGSRLIDVCK